MRKRDPNQVIESFVAGCAESTGELRRVLEAVGALPLAVQRNASRDAFFRLAVRWEVFRSEWFVAAAARDLNVLAASTLEVLRGVVRGRDNVKGFAPYLSLDLPRNLTLAEVQDLLDPDGRNVRLSAKPEGNSGKDGWQARAERQLAHPFAHRVTAMPLADLKVIALVEHLRDCIAHASQKSTVQLRAAVEALDPSDALQLAPGKPLTTGNLGLYLHAPIQGERRVKIFHDRLAAIAAGMRR